jgi:long-chain fatty acid transport protein
MKDEERAKRVVGMRAGAAQRHSPLFPRLRAGSFAALALLPFLLSKTTGFDKQGFDQTGAVQGFGWEDIMVLATGLELSPSSAFALRGGWNYSENPVPDELSLFNIPAPAIVQHHATFGLGFQPFAGVNVDLAYYHVFENEISGPMFGPMGPISGSSVSSKMYEDSFIMTFSFTPDGM